LLVWLDLPTFIGLSMAAFTVAVVNTVFVADFSAADAGSRVATAFGENMGGIGIPILMAAVIGKSMLESGAAQQIIQGFQNVLGESNSDISLLGSSSFLAVPVFFDSIFYLMAPLTGQLEVHTAYLVMVIGAGANIFSWYNDSGFWLVKETGGLTQGETLRTWTVLTTIISVSGLLTSLLQSTIFPFA